MLFYHAETSGYCGKKALENGENGKCKMAKRKLTKRQLLWHWLMMFTLE